MSWIHKKCSGIKGSLRRDPDFSCAGFLGKARPIDGRLMKEVLVDDEKAEAVPEFCYMGDMLTASGGCELAAVTQVQIGSGQVPPTTPSPHQSQSASFDQRSSVFNLCTATCSRNMCNDWLHFVDCSPMTVQ